MFHVPLYFLKTEISIGLKIKEYILIKVAHYTHFSAFMKLHHNMEIHTFCKIVFIDEIAVYHYSSMV